MINIVWLSQGRNLAGEVGLFPESYIQTPPPNTLSSPVVVPETTPLSSTLVDKTQPPASSLPSIGQTQPEPVREGTNSNNTAVNAAPNGTALVGNGGVMRDTMAISEHGWALDAVDSNSSSPPLPSSIHDMLSEIGITPSQLVDSRELLEQAHRSEALMGRAEPSVEMLEAAVALARRAEASIRSREAAVQKKEAEVNLKQLEIQRREAELDRQEEEVRLKEVEATRKYDELVCRIKDILQNRKEARLAPGRASWFFAQMRDSEVKKREAEAQLRDAEPQAREVEVLVRETEAKEEARRLEGRSEHLLEQTQGIMSAYRQEAKGPRIVPETRHNPANNPAHPGINPSRRLMERKQRFKTSRSGHWRHR